MDALDARNTPEVRAVGAPLVRCADVARTYGSGAGAVVAVHGLTCEVLPGARIAVVGPSGSGKSTLLHLMAGLDRPTAGRVTHPGLGGSGSAAPGMSDHSPGDGRPATEVLARHIGVVFQGPSLLPPLTAAENVALPLRIDGVPAAEADARALAALESLGLGALAARLPDELSAGQAQRVAVARVLARRPRLVLADEPTGQLDRETGHQVLTVLLTAAAELGAAVLVTTHDQRVARELDERWYMADGRLIHGHEISGGGDGDGAGHERRGAQGGGGAQDDGVDHHDGRDGHDRLGRDRPNGHDGSDGSASPGSPDGSRRPEPPDGHQQRRGPDGPDAPDGHGGRQQGDAHHGRDGQGGHPR
ncbi:ATP-binding cassette domain-containing protein [Streptomyces sp. NPDC091292]|uniref:ABC transporter ATP-binding protein n=1 Tax=Streptomyces sp. NPDC091292 TaxID=3365991 RepID=UPI003811BB13